MSVAEKVRKAVVQKVERRGALPHAEVNAKDYPQSPAPSGTKVRIAHAEVPDDSGRPVRSAAGREARIDGSPYVAVGGANKGKVIQPVRVEGTGEVLGVPEDRLERRGGSKSRGCFAPGAGVTDEEWDRIFGKKKRR